LAFGWNTIEVCLVVPEGVQDEHGALESPLWFGLNLGVSLAGLTVTPDKDSKVRLTAAQNKPLPLCTFFDLSINTPLLFLDRVGVTVDDTSAYLFVPDSSPRYLLKTVDSDRSLNVTNARVIALLTTTDPKNRPYVDEFTLRLF
jgi:hypothetical protein